MHEFKDNHVYIGLTSNLKTRNYKHLKGKNSSVFIHIQKTNIKPILIQLTDYIDVKIAKIKEGEFLNDYRKNGWFILNISKTGGIGCTSEIWTKQHCQEVALSINTIKEFKEKYISAYIKSTKNKWLDEICEHMIDYNTIRFYYNNYDKCLNKAKELKERTSFSKTRAYTASIKNNWINDIFKEMKWKKHHNNKFN